MDGHMAFRQAPLLLVILFALVTGTFWASVAARTGPAHDKVVVCYISTWAVYRPGQGAYSIENFDPSLCTHVVYAFAGLDITQAAIKSLDPWQDLKEEYGKGGYERLTALKRSHPHLKVSLAIGGWNEGSKNYSTLVSNVEQRQYFAKQVSAFVRKYNFDGLDLDWEYPTQRGGRPQDRENFVALTKDLREEFDNNGLLLTSAIGAAKHVIDKAYDVRQISRYLDYLHIMCYDYHGSWDQKIGNNAPLTSSAVDPLSVQYSIDYLLQLGAPPSKLVLGLPFYGRTFKTVSQGNLNDASDGVGFRGPYTREDGFLGYNEICNILSNKTSGWSKQWDAETSQMLARSERNVFTQDVSVVTFDSSRSIANKVKFAMKKRLAGVMVWSVDTDDFLGNCELDEDTYADFRLVTSAPRRLNHNYPLLRTINEATSLALEELAADEVVVPDDSENEIPHGSIADRKNAATSIVSLGLTASFLYTILHSFTN
ncbi:Cht2 [Drosophila busckii]|uniref:Cht2 n=1 Tax=Drosophila busckii TaxID=30019 RepID=A0A0M5JBP2_DROBS|nr:probable chitinase 2 [Drosophila busckii]XP_017842473.1 probable chitinase 2 [Drosophila busckii]XP_017842475.1 probable chitinase 2 [Drosophila busckii]ALC44806.1 Cht2 [Drosophila busckii]